MVERNNPAAPETWDNEFALHACWELWVVRRREWLKARKRQGIRGDSLKMGRAQKEMIKRRIQVHGPKDVAHALLGVYLAGLEKPTLHEALRESQQRQNVPKYAKLYRDYQAAAGVNAVKQLTGGKLF